MVECNVSPAYAAMAAEGLLDSVPVHALPRRNSELPIGFTPIRNKRIELAIAAEGLRLIADGHKPKEVMLEAIRLVARKLPPLPFQRRHRLPRPSKSDNPEYRKVAVA